ncbi:MAG: hypothetical protein E3K32_00525 [wastewater metagenome]|nr:hypothetical protein [Candidatus Loosdrechtia aerotolerans]
MYPALIQGIYYIITGIWPLMSMRTFQMVTGPKTNHWLVNTVGVLIIVIGGVLIITGIRRTVYPDIEIILLALGSAIGLAAIDIVYVVKKQISPIYLLDMCIEVVFIINWIFV